MHEDRVVAADFLVVHLCGSFSGFHVVQLEGLCSSLHYYYYCLCYTGTRASIILSSTLRESSLTEREKKGREGENVERVV